MAAPDQTIAIASDHAGVALKAHLVEHLRRQGYAVLDLGPTTDASVDYPDYAAKLAACLQTGEASRGVLICGSGIGISIAANRFPHIRAALCHTPEAAALARQHNDANVLCLGARGCANPSSGHRSLLPLLLPVLGLLAVVGVAGTLPESPMQDSLNLPGLAIMGCVLSLIAFGLRHLLSRNEGEKARKQILDRFLTTSFEGGRHAGRVAKLAAPQPPQQEDASC